MVRGASVLIGFLCTGQAVGVTFFIGFARAGGGTAFFFLHALITIHPQISTVKNTMWLPAKDNKPVAMRYSRMNATGIQKIKPTI